jgi:hypothetical protein
MDPNPLDPPAPPEYHRVKSPPCGSCGYATSVRLEHVIHGDDVTSTWRCEVCGARWPAEEDLGSGPKRPQSNVAGAATASSRPRLDNADDSGHNILFAYLSELIDTLDRRVPRGHADTENQIARAATALRREMLEGLSLRQSDGLTVLQRS